MWLDVGHTVHGFLGWVERDLIRFAPLVQLDLTLLGPCHDGVDAGIVFELIEPIQIVGVNNFHESCPMFPQRTSVRQPRRTVWAGKMLRGELSRV